MTQLVAAPALTVGTRVRLTPAPSTRWWTVQAVSDNFVACVRQAEFQTRGTLMYTVLDWRRGLRGPCNLIGRGWGDGSYSQQECAELLQAFESDEVEVSHRSNVPLEILAVEAGRS